MQNPHMLQLVLMIVIWVGCTSQSEERPLNTKSVPEIQVEDILGTWSNLSMRITYLDLDSLYEVPEGKWEEMLEIQPIKTTYRSDSTYQSEYFKLDGKPLFTSVGKWYLQDDSIYLESQGVITAYKFTRENNVGRFVGILDWNEDGKSNELYDGRQKRL